MVEDNATKVTAAQSQMAELEKIFGDSIFDKEGKIDQMTDRAAGVEDMLYFCSFLPYLCSFLPHFCFILAVFLLICTAFLLIFAVFAVFLLMFAVLLP